jgi:adenylate cyclase
LDLIQKINRRYYKIFGWFQLILTFFLLANCYDNSQKIDIENEKGVLEFQSKEIYDVTTHFKFVPYQFLNLEDIEVAERMQLSISASKSRVWKNYGYASLQDYGFGTFYLKLQTQLPLEDLAIRLPLISSAYQIKISESNTLRIGMLSESKQGFVPSILPKVLHLKGQEKEFTIILHVSNFYDNSGGLWGSVLIGRKESIFDYHSSKLQRDWIIFGILMFMGVYHIGLFTISKFDKSLFYFGVFCVIIALRSIISENRYLSHILPLEYQYIEHKIEYLTFFFSVPSFLMYLGLLFKLDFKISRIYIINTICLPFVIFVLFFPLELYRHSLSFFQIFVLIVIGYISYRLFSVFKNYREGLKTFMFGLIMLISSVLMDIFHNMNLISFGYVSSLGVIAFFFSQAFLLSMRYSKAFNQIEEFSERLSKLNQSYFRFVPHDVLRLLKKNEILDIKLGDQIQTNMTVLFTDIRNFTTLSETMTSEENFNFINSFLKRISPVVRMNKGFIDKFIGDAIMALFPYKVEDAVDSAISMHQTLVKYNEHRRNSGYQAIEIGIGIHSGVTMLGIIGETERIDSTVISDSVNLASRLEGLTKIYGVNIIVSEEIYNTLRDNKKYKFRFLDIVKVKGKQRVIQIYQLLNSLNLNDFQIIMGNLELYNKAISFYQNQDFKNAYKAFEELMKKNSNDPILLIYRDRCKTLIEGEIDLNWTPVIEYR